MKKIISMIVIIIAIINNSSAQELRDNFRERPSLGFKAGANYSNVYDAQGDAFNTDPKFGFATGVFATIPIGKYFGFQPEVLFSQKGFKATGIILGSNYSFTRTTSYIDVPLLFAFKPGKYLTLLIGPQYSYLLKQKDEFANSVTSIEQEKTFANDNVRKNTLCYTGGFDLSFQHIVFGARAAFDVQNNSGDGTSATPRYKNMWCQATIGFRF